MKEKKPSNNNSEHQEELSPPMEESKELSMLELLEQAEVLRLEVESVRAENEGLRSELNALKSRPTSDEDVLNKLLGTLDEMSKGIALPEILRVSKDGITVMARPDLLVGWIDMVRAAFKKKHGK